jgi:hypothetical protein
MADVGDLAAVGREDRLDREAEARVEEADTGLRGIEQCDEAIVSAMADEEQPPSVGGPLQPPDLAPGRGELARLAAALPKPDLAAPGEGEARPVGGEGRRMAVADRERLAASGRSHEDLLPGRGGLGGRVRHRVVAGIGVSAANEGEAGPVGAQRQIVELLPVVLGEGGQPTRRPPGLSEPDVANARQVLDPGEARSVLGPDQLGGDRQRQSGGQRVRLRRGRNRRRQPYRQPQKRPPRHCPY